MKKLLKTAFPLLIMFGFIALLFGCASQPGPKSDAETSQTPPLAVIQSVAAQHTADGISVTIVADRPVTFSSLKQPDPPAVMLYFPETSIEEAEVIQPRGVELIPHIVTRQQNNGRTARIEIQLAEDAAYEAVKAGNAVQVLFKSAAASPQPAGKTVAQSDTVQAEKVAFPSSRPQPSPIDPARLDSAKADLTAAWVNKIEFLNQADGRSILAVSTTRAVEYRIHKVSARRVDIHLFNTRIPSYHQRPLITTRFESAVDRIMPVVPDTTKNESVISIDLREQVAYLAEQADNLLLVHFEPSAVPPRALEASEMPEWKRVLIDEQGFVPLTRSPTEPDKPVLSLQDGRQQDLLGSSWSDERAILEDAELMSIISPARRTFTGEKIALDFYETDIKNVFRILREVSGKNFAIDRNVTGKVTMTLDQPVPWDQVLDLVLRMNQLGMAQEGNILRIATLETLRREDDLRKAKLEAFRKQREELKALEPLITKYIPVSYSNAALEVRPHIEKILTRERGSISVDEKNNQIIITDTAERVHQAEEIVRRIDKVTAQVVIEARVVEVSDTFRRELGFRWGLGVGPGELNAFNNILSTADMAMNFPALGAASTIGVTFSRLTGVPFLLEAKLNALETMGEGRILSSPRILTLNNKKAKIKQGVEYPYLERDSSGGSSVKFKNIDLLLEVTPHVTPDNRIAMNIYITKNDVAGLTAGVPSVATNEAQTELLVNDADTIVIGGIIKASETSGQDGFPGLSRIPLLGWMFKNHARSRQSNELLIFITPRIVQLEQTVAQSN